ncbi:hypothetical protein DWB77_00983 [Streptomyces hundungensis]|uniref:Uncharacterized protein n=1 Tax=Streptomyces hundungensis TaxID=1077946 RepID=A0A387H611_9ACTN|nr:hypothetical protein [Streptomyces hundungensis]AYG78874.1 hypothetical protein DWB77_00983 [Streptomyces hundungensis]
MTMEAGTRQEERVPGRVWTVRLAPYGRPSAGAVTLSCSRPACADQRFPGGAAAGRKAAVAHVNMHLAHIRTSGGPRREAWCACRAADCAWHTPDPAVRRREAPPTVGTSRCGGPVVLTVYADRAGRLWRIAETCARCAAATPGCRALDTAPPPAQPGRIADERVSAPEPSGGTAGESVAPVFSDRLPSPAGEAPPVPATGAAPVPRARVAPPGTASGRAGQRGKIAQRIVPADLQPDVLRVELIDLGDAFRAYQQRTEPDLVLLAELHERKARAFALWADVSGDGDLRHEARRAEKAAQTTLEMHHNRTGGPGDGSAAPERLLTPKQATHARSVLEYVRTQAPGPEPEVRLAVLMLTLRAARAGTGNITGQDLTGWLGCDAEHVLESLVAADWLRLPATVTEALASQPEDPTAITVPALLPEQPRPFDFGKTSRARISGWAQKAVGDRKIRKSKLGAATRLLALYTAAHARADGTLAGPGSGELPLEQAALFCGVSPDEIVEHAALLEAADWLSEVDTSAGTLRGRLTERVLPLAGLVS